MIIGAGAAGLVILKELKVSNDANARPVCVIDDNPNKWGRLIEGIPIVGGRESIMEAAEKYKIDQIMFAIPSVSAEQKRDILNICKETGCELLSLPGIYQMTNGRGLFKQNEAGCSGGSAGKRSNQGKYGRDFPAS